MIGSYVLSFQVYLALPLQAEYLAGANAQVLVSALFVVSGIVAVAGQLRITEWFEARWGTGRSLAVGMAILSAAFLPLLAVPGPGRFGVAAAVAALLLSTAVLAVGTAAVFPFEMDTVVSLAGGKPGRHPLRLLQHDRRCRHPGRQSRDRRCRGRRPRCWRGLGGLGGTRPYRRTVGLHATPTRPITIPATSHARRP
ncbi:putative transporter [Nocardia asteroides NBRC 15531]|uniref:Transporter n=1 Tax=Nocardia asteroides NBRC 15531 TaxID=1110697 RepID=U5EDW1_NOCAS|nr:putative transporter [Nocardia asteroides NBRC 15531]